MRRENFLARKIFTLFSVFCFAVIVAGFFLTPNKTLLARAEDLSVTVEKIELPPDENSTIIFYLSKTDFITAEFDENDNTAARYKWVDTLTYENREKNNVCNALLDKNLSDYNYGEYITVDGVALKNIRHEFRANKFQRIEGLGLTFLDGVLPTANEIYIKAGCTLPTLARGYFGVEEPSAIIIEEDTIYRKREGQWVKAYPFNGYEEGVVYDASERYFYKRVEGSSLHGHPEAPTCEFSNGYKPVGDEDFVLCSNTNTLKGNLFILDIVNPIDSTEFGNINLRFYVHEPRTMVTYNANGVTKESLGEVLEEVSTARGWTNVSLMLPLYADENGMVDRIVFQFTNDGDKEEVARNQVGIGEFSVSREKISTMLYDKSLLIMETETDYNIFFRFNKKGEFLSDEVDDTAFRINGESIADINENGEFATIKWVSLQGIYQINVVLSKSYQGDGQIKNADIGYACNKISIIKGLQFPNGEVLDRTYHYNLYRNFTDNIIFENEVVIDYEIAQTYDETKVDYLTWDVDNQANDNLHITIMFDKKITNRMINHVCEPESWRESILQSSGLYDGEYSKVFIAGGYKSSMLDSITINGQTIGEFHARNSHQTCVFIHYGQRGSYSLDMSIDANAPAYRELRDLFDSGSGVTIEIKSGLKFTTGVKTMEDQVFVLTDGKFVLQQEKPTYNVYFDGKLVKDGETIKVDYPALKSSVFVSGVDFETEMQESGNIVTFTVKYDGISTTFKVEQNVAKESNEPSGNGSKGGCGSSVSTVSGVGLLALAVYTVNKRRRKEDE